MRLDLRRVPSWRHSRPDEMETEIREPRGSVHLRTDHARRAFCQRVVRVDLERLAELPPGLPEVSAAMSLETVPPEIQCLGAGVRCGHSSLRAPTPRGADRTSRQK